ncbi:uncharacterized protein PODANS_3_2800 [Podospora anserina S mat+]|uniref:Podospora anserina S mat+ genomic DNA chromosome 3, supercontig 2 n=1 Tax=Podospora anserina (strain S / ATCC MYA-4624 / DSM 980 / FGSC 10383) TaxID=515849 RepID=B2AZT3_PODAN|nr:uncharacterized protein PODANS_3_2800 [Podospora anserina S mat+]CAP70183.1 unnamed protein product [Podospora anserina S mat+]CDP26776.1 Putative protein of unknown function [Podospora anserina S mat+]
MGWGIRRSSVTLTHWDECNESQLGDMLSSFESLGRDAVSTGRNVRICFSSRHYPIFDLERSLKFDLETQQGHTDDIIKYINIKLKPGRHPKADELKERLQSRANGVFIWVALVIDMLNKDLA